MSERERAIDSLRYGGASGQLCDTAELSRRAQPSPEEISLREAEQRKWQRQQSRREMLVAVCALGKRYESVAEAITDARELAAFIGVELD